MGGGIAGLRPRRTCSDAREFESRSSIATGLPGESGNMTAHLTEIIDARYHRLDLDFWRGGGPPCGRVGPRGNRIHRAPGGGSRDFLRFSPRARLPLCRDAPAEAGNLKKSFERFKPWVPAPSGSRRSPCLSRPPAGSASKTKPSSIRGKYLLGLARAFVEGGGLIFEDTPAQSFEDGMPCRVRTPAA